ncbi:MAG: hypothetical protein IKS76_01560 [Paludibacteraceae bacterium]|nr:hypothetical protein [Paludibacteraceae bacterium]
MITRTYSADFETNNHADGCHVWEWGLTAVKEDAEINDVATGDELAEFMARIERLAPCTVYFTNLRFDGHFILDFLFSHGFEFTEDRNPKAGQFGCTISEQGEFFNIRVAYKDKGKRVKVVEFRDSLKIIPMGIAEMAESFGLDIQKIEEPDDFYNKNRPAGYKATEEERTYVKTDVVIMARCLAQMLERGFEKMTIGSNAIEFYKKQSEDFALFTGANGADEFLRRAYKGGWCYVNPNAQKAEQGEGFVLDINSMYPYILRNRLLPYGTPIYYKGKFNILLSERFPLYVQHIRCEFELKEGYLPFIQLKGNYGYQQTEYVTSTDLEQEDLWLTNKDLELFFEHYNVDNIEYVDGYMFHAKMGMFNDYIDYWYEEKKQAGREGNKGKRQIAKLFLNNIGGKFSINPKFRNKTPYYEDGIVKFKFTEYKERESLYLPVGIFMTSYARCYIVRAAQALGERFNYADTDSLHITGTELPKDLLIDNEELGAFKVEAMIKRGKYLHSKCYCEEISEDGGKTWHTKVTVAGLPHKLHGQHTYEEFKAGVVYENKLQPKAVKGGVILVPKDYKVGA